MPGSLDSDQVKRYREDGYLCSLDFLDETQLKFALGELEQADTQHQILKLKKDLAEYLRINAQILFPFVYQIAREPILLDMVESILGENILIYSAEFFIKQARTDKLVSWHQDLTYWGLGETDEELTAWVALSEVNTESGCMRFVPGSHKQGIQPHKDTYADNNLLSRGQEISVDVDESKTVNAELKPGQVSFHHGRLFHASGPNRSDHARIGLAIRYVTPAVRQLHGERDFAMMARGIDNTQNWVHLTPPTELFDATNLALYEGIRAEQTRVLMRETA